MIEILVKVLGWQMVSQALRDRDKAKDYADKHNELVRQSCNTLSDYWLNGNPSDYLEGLDTDLRNCLICVLATDISADAIADMGLIEV
jgi:hypothetical protein